MKVGVREICDVVFKAKARTTIGTHTFQAGEPVIYFDTLKTSTLEGASTTVYAQGGRGNARLLAWEGERTLTFTMEDALISTKGLAILTGADLIHAGADKDGTNIHKVLAHATFQGVVGDGNKVTIIKDNKEYTVSTADGAETYVMLLDGNGEMSGVPVKITGEDSIVGNVITLPDVFAKGDVVFVDFYHEYEEDAVEISITPDKFAGYYYVEASTLFRRESDGVDLPAEFVIPKAKVQSAFTFTMASSGDPSTFTFTLDALPDYTKFNPTKKVLCAIQVLEADDNYDLTSNEDENGAVEYQRVQYNKDGEEADNAKAIYMATAKKQTKNDSTLVPAGE